MDQNPPNPSDDQPQHRRNTHLSINKLSHKIAKPSSSNPIQTQSKPTLDPPPPLNPNPPPVYNISKSDFRDMVQKLTGPPPGELAEMSRAQQNAPKPPSSRLHRIRPPPLAQLSANFASSPLGNQSQSQNRHPGVQQMGQSGALTHFGAGFVRAGAHVGQPLSPLPPFPAVHAAAESPISAYMRHLRGSGSGFGVDSEPRRLSGFSPRWRGAAQEESALLGFGCLPSPKSPNLLLSPKAGQLGLPLSPTGKP
uniref:VQ domain-containing protein n=1 Tax=Kalanchoe fedtschenkoi TaxID=63787 RepID=A0A7N0UJS4_KALFE